MPEGDIFKRRCGTVLIMIVLTAMDEYTVTLSDGDDEVGLVIHPPVVLTVSLDSEEAIDRVARAAMSFAVDQNPGSFQGADQDGSGWLISREQ